MRVLRSKKRLALAAAALAAIAFGAGAAVAAVISQVVLADTHDVRLRIVRTEADGFDSGWHTHPGPAIVQVQQGRFKIYQGSCRPHVVRRGETFLETPDLAVRAVAQGKIKWTTTLILPDSPPNAPQTPVSDPCA